MPPPPLRIFYDADCRICAALAARWAPLVARRGYAMVPVQSATARGRLGLGPGEVPAELKVETAAGRIRGGIDGILHLCRQFWWAWPLWLLGHLPGVHALLVRRYRHLAAHRTCAVPAQDH